MSERENVSAPANAALRPESTPLLEKHYRGLSKSYDQYLRYSGNFVPTLSKKMAEKLRLKETDRLVDLGGGTGIFTKGVLDQVHLKQPVVLVDPFAEMLRVAEDDPCIRCVESDALAFSERPEQYDKVLIKEAIHHVEDRDRLYANLYERLPKGGRVLLVHVPPDVQYPLFAAALERALSWHTPPANIMRGLHRAGFSVQHDRLTYRHRLPKELYFDMVRSQYMTVLSSFSDEEIETGLSEMAETYADQEMLSFPDIFDFVLGEKEAACGIDP